MDNFVKNLLIVDDDIIDFMFLNRILRSTNLNIIYAKDGLEAWQLINSEVVHYLISDIDMPKMNGIELVNSIRSSNNFEIKEMPIIVISGNEDLKLMENHRNYGIDFFLAKPPNIKHLNRIINLILGGNFYYSAA